MPVEKMVSSEEDQEKTKKYNQLWNARNKENRHQWYKNNADKFIKYKKRSQESGSNYAKLIVLRAIRKGTIIDLKKVFVKCRFCPDRATQHDHRDYNFPLQITPVCKSCNLKLGPAIWKKK